MTVGVRRSIGISVLWLFMALAASTQGTKIYSSVAVMDFRFSGITEEQMQSAVDRISRNNCTTQRLSRWSYPYWGKSGSTAMSIG